MNFSYSDCPVFKQFHCCLSYFASILYTWYFWGFIKFIQSVYYSRIVYFFSKKMLILKISIQIPNWPHLFKFLLLPILLNWFWNTKAPEKYIQHICWYSIKEIFINSKASSCKNFQSSLRKFLVDEKDNFQQCV